jgi:hypothetical protein
MKKLLLSLFLAFTWIVNSQTVIQFDNMETSSPSYLTAGWFIPASTATWATNTSVSPSTSAVLYGLGSGTSSIEQDWYSMPNVTGLNSSRQYQLKFRLASQTFTNSTAATRGLDAADLLEVQVSTNGGTTYITELRIAGNSNAQWPYTSTGTITHTANGSFTNSAAPTGDVYQAPAGVTTTGPSTITLNLPLNISQVAIDIFCRVNSSGEEWWLDNIQLIEIVALPVELTLFEGFSTEQGNVIRWQTASEYNSSHYLLERSTTGEFDENNTIQIVQAAGNSTEMIDYVRLDKGYSQTINYYRLVQVDFDGKFEVYGPVSINNSFKIKKVIKVVNTLGQEVDETATGILFEVYEDGTSKKIIR